MNQFINWGLAILIVFLLSACGTPLNDYHPKNEEEKEIKTLLVQFTENRNNYDVNNMASCLADNCSIDYFGRSLTKASFVSGMKRSDLESRGKFKYTNPKFNIADKSAQVSIVSIQKRLIFGVARDQKIRLYFSLRSFFRSLEII